MNNAFRVPLKATGGMPEYRSQTIGPEAGANVSARYDDRAAGIVLAQANRNAQADAQGWDKFNKGLQTFLHEGNKLYNEYVDRTSRAYVDEALLSAREEMEAWRKSYDETHKGQDGLQAAADYQAQWAKISEAHMKGLRDKGVTGPYERLADLHLRENGLHYDNQGLQFQRQQDKSWNTSLLEGKQDGLVRAVQDDPDNAAWHGYLKAGLLDTYRRLHPGEDISKYEHAIDNLIATNRIDVKIAAKDFAGAAADVTAFSGGGHRGDRVAQFESGAHGVRAIGYDRNGGTSYGKYQLSSKQQSYQEWLDELEKAGPEGAAAAKRIKAVGGYNTGSRSGAAVEAYRKEAEANPELFERTQREYIEKRHYGPMLAKLPADERAMIEGNAGLQEMAWSVAVQHGGGGGAKLLARAWKDGMNNEDFVDAVYGARGGYFGSSTPEVQASVRSRFGRERGLIRGMLQQEGTPGGQGQSALTPQQRIAYSQKIETGEKKQTVDDFLTNTMGMPVQERLALLDKQYGNNPEMREEYDLMRKGVMSDYTAQKQREAVDKHEQEQQLIKQAEALVDQPWAETQKLISALPLHEQAHAYNIVKNIRAAKMQKPDDPAALQEADARLLAGEEINYKADYGDRLSPETIMKREDKQFRAAVPLIKQAFMDTYNEYAAVDKNKKMMKTLGIGSANALWTRFISQNEGAFKDKDLPRIRQAAADFFKKVTLDKDRFIGSTEFDTIAGLIPSHMSSTPDANVRPVQGTPEYEEVTNKLKEMGVKPETWGGAYSAKQLSAGFAALQAEKGQQRKRGEE